MSSYKIIFILFIISLSSCSNKIDDLSSFGRLVTYNSSDGRSLFSFEISDKFKISKSKSKVGYTQITKQEIDLLRFFLKKNNYCINNKNNISFEILSKQDKVYDVTIESLVKDQYNVKSLTPVTYFGRCL